MEVEVEVETGNYVETEKKKEMYIQVLLFRIIDITYVSRSASEQSMQCNASS